MKKIFCVALLAIFAGCANHSVAHIEPVYVSAEAVEIGEGETTFQLMVACDDDVSFWLVSTDEETVGAALFGLGMIDGEVGAFGLFVTSVNGITADFAENGAWWAFWAGDEMSATGVDATPAEHGGLYAFIYTR